MHDSPSENDTSSNAKIDTVDLLEQQELEWRRGNREFVEQFIAKYPSTRDKPERLLDLIHNEISLRKESGELPELSEYLRRFPHISEALRIQWEVNRLLLSGDADDSEQVTNPVVSLHRIGRYEILSMLGQGGVGVVYKAWDPVLKRIVALKLLKSGQHASSQELARFRIEAEAVARMSHECIVRVYDVAEVNGEPYIAMEYCSGGNLADRLRRTPLTVRAAAEIIRRVALGVSAAHQMQIIHRDLKPANVFLQPLDAAHSDLDLDDTQREEIEISLRSVPVTVEMSGVHHGDVARITPKVSDFGLAKLLDIDDGQTRSGTILGTPAYMAPEQTYGNEQQIGPAVDVYAVGAMLYECLAGRPPFGGSTIVETLEQVRSREPVPLRKIQPGVPADLETITLKCLQKEPGNRYASMQLVVDELGRYLKDEPIIARPVSRTERCVRWCRRNPGLAALSSFAAVLVCCLVVASVWLKLDRDLVRQSEQKAIQAEHDGLGNLYQAYLGEVRSSRSLKAQGQRENGLRAIRNTIAAFAEVGLTDTQQAELRDEAIASLALPDLREVDVRPQPNTPKRVFSYNNNPTETYLEWDDAQGHLLIRHLGDHAIQNRIPALSAGPRQSINFTLSPCGSWLAETVRNWDSGQGHQLRIWDRRNDRLVVDQKLEIVPGSVEFSAQQKLYIGGQIDGSVEFSVYRFDLTERRFELSFPARSFKYRFAVSPTGRFLAMTGRGQPADILDATTGERIHSISDIQQTTCVAWSPDGSLAVFGTADGRLYQWDVEKKEGHFLPGSEPLSIDRVHLSADGRSLAATTAGWIIIHDRNSEYSPLRLPGEFLGFYQRGRRLTTSSEGQLRSYELDAQQSCRTLPAHAEMAEFSPDGNWLGLSSDDGTSIYDARTLNYVEILNRDASGPIAFDPLGKEHITFGMFSHAWRWPVESLMADRTHFRIGPPSAIRLNSGSKQWGQIGLEPHHWGRHAAWSRDGRLLALADYRHHKIWLKERGDKTELKEFAELWNADRVALSPDGKWLAAAATHLAGGTVWRVSDRSAVLKSPNARHILFSPDGEWLAISTLTNVELRRTDESFSLVSTFERTHADIFKPTAIAFEPQSRLLAMTASGHQVKLLELATGDIVATLSHSEAAADTWLSFSADGTHLAEVRTARDVVVWNLSHLAEQLRDLGLDHRRLPLSVVDPVVSELTLEVRRGNLPSARQWTENWKLLAMAEAIQWKFPEAIADITSGIKSIGEANPKLQAEFLSLRGEYQLKNGSPSVAWSDWDQALALNPKSIRPRIALCRLALFGPAELRNPDRVVMLIAPLIVDLPNLESGIDGTEVQRLLGYAQIRRGKYQAGLDILARCADSSNDPIPLYFQAEAHHYLLAPDAAKMALMAGAAIQTQQKETVSLGTLIEWERTRTEVSKLIE
jgi:serine/threonine protein kinase/WD40 repeat protein